MIMIEEGEEREKESERGRKEGEVVEDNDEERKVKKAEEEGREYRERKCGRENM